MKISYDPEVDILQIILNDAAVEESDESKPGIILDYDKEATSSASRCSTPPNAWPAR